MKTILCFGDSNTWGYDPIATAASPYLIRHPHDVRWTGVLARELGGEWRVIEEGQNGRTTVHDDPFTVCRNAADYLPACLESHKPIDIVAMMLGTNDLKDLFNVSAVEIALGAGVLAKMILQSDAGPKARPPRLLLICPPAIGGLSQAPEIAAKFKNAEEKSKQLPARYEALASQLGCGFLNAQTIITASPLDGIHLEAGEHDKLGKAVAAAIRGA